MSENVKLPDKKVGNANLVSLEEEKIAAFLRARNLDNTNEKSLPVVPRDTMYTRVWKRVLDVAIALPCCLIILPINLVFAVFTYFDVGRPILYKQTRYGKNGKPFTLIKFRNMNNKTDENGRLLPPSERVTKFGKIMRKFSLDELLNFVSVLKGDMSIIGPRPMPVFIVDRMSERHRGRLAARPGLECPRFLKNDDETVSQWNKEFENAVWYVENVSLKTDIMLCFMLVKMTFSIKKRAKNAGGLSYFVGYDDNGNATSLKKLKEDFPEVLNEINDYED